MNPDHIAALVLIAGAVTWVAAFVARELWTEWRIRASERQWRAWFAALPESERRAGAERLLAAVLDLWDCEWCGEAFLPAEVEGCTHGVALCQSCADARSCGDCGEDRVVAS